MKKYDDARTTLMDIGVHLIKVHDQLETLDNDSIDAPAYHHSMAGVRESAHELEKRFEILRMDLEIAATRRRIEINKADLEQRIAARTSRVQEDVPEENLINSEDDPEIRVKGDKEQCLTQ